jgi:Putative Actinobacterial Holin-X, holin superfamily III
MDHASRSVPTRQLLADLVQQISDLVSIEFRLFRAELGESSARASSGLGFLAGGLCVFLAALVILLIAAAALLVRLGAPPDLACLIVAIGALAVGAILVALGLRALKPAKLVPTRSLNQISSMIHSSPVIEDR